MGPIILLFGVLLYGVLYLVVRFTKVKPKHQGVIACVMSILYVLGKGLVYLFIAMFIIPVMLLQFWVNLWCPITRGYSRKY